ncbi:MAG: NifB/NifX family molybdenum-iron cluster-binding protein [Promethearchaeota archaeon]
MSQRVVVPVLNEEGEESKLSPHFGRAPYFAVAEVERSGKIQSLEFKMNRSSHFGGQGHPPDLLLSFNPDIVITYGMGPRALRAFQAESVAVLQANVDTLGGVLRAFARDELVELTEGCREARHK